GQGGEACVGVGDSDQRRADDRAAPALAAPRQGQAMTKEREARVLANRKALVVGIANDSSIAYGCAKAFHELGADIAITYLNDKAHPHVEPLAKEIEAAIFERLDVSVPGELEAVFEKIAQQWGALDILVHS